MKKEFTDIIEVESFVEYLLNEEKYEVGVDNLTNGKFCVQWFEKRTYTAQDGKEYREEVWMTKEGEMKFIQDIDVEHARNIIRMMLRKEREANIELDKMRAQMAEVISDIINKTEEEDLQEQAPPNTLLH